MSGHGSGRDDDDDPEIHLPPPSFSPPLIALGVMLVSFGVLATPALIVAGGVIVLVGIVTWLIDDARTFVAAGDAGDGGHAPSGGGH